MIYTEYIIDEAEHCTGIYAFSTQRKAKDC